MTLTPEIAMQIPSYAFTRQTAQAFADSYDPENGDSLREYLDIAASTVYPFSMPEMVGHRSELKKLIRGLIRERRSLQ